MERKTILIFVTLLLASCRIDLRVEGDGTVSSVGPDAALHCDQSGSPDCSAQYTAPGTEVLLATPGEGFTLSSWEGCNYLTLFTCETPILQQAIDNKLHWDITAYFKPLQLPVQPASYTYNAMGQRVTKTVNSRTTIFVYDTTGNLIAELDQSGRPVRSHIHIDNEPIALISTDTVDQSSSVYYVHTDHLGTPGLLTDQNGEVVADRESMPFGETFADYAQVEYGQRFPGQYEDTETGLHYNYFRDYDPGLGRYIQSDPTGLVGGINTYAYAGSNPVGMSDPLGLRPIPSNPWTQEACTVQFTVLDGFLVLAGSRYVKAGFRAFRKSDRLRDVLGPIGGEAYLLGGGMALAQAMCSNLPTNEEVKKYSDCG